MNTVFVLRDKLRSLYAGADFVILPVIRFLTALVFLLVLRNYLGISNSFSGVGALSALSLVCAFFPSGCISLIASFFVIAGLYKTSLLFAAASFAVFFMIFILYFGFRPGGGILIMLVPVTFIIGIPYVVPIILGMSFGIFSVIPACLGVFVYFLLRFFHNSDPAAYVSADIIKMLARTAKGFLTDRKMYIVMFAFIVCIVLVYLISHSGILHAWTVSVGAGISALAVIMLLIGSYESEKGFMFDILGLVLSLCIALAYEFLVYAVDYKGTERLNFEDDDYFYYIKAIPRIRPYDEDTRRE